MVTIQDVAQWRREKASVNHETYKMLHAQVETRIKQMVETNMRATQMFYTIPIFVPGRPVYDPMHAKRYIAEKVRRAGFVVIEHDYPRHALTVNWSSPTVPPPHPSSQTKSRQQHYHTSPKAPSNGRDDQKTISAQGQGGSDISSIARQLANLKKVIGA
jgi:hypothetical protein